MRKIKFIANPISGDGKGKNAALQIENYFKNKKTDYSIDLIPHPGKIPFLVKILNTNTSKYYDASQLYDNIKIPIVNNSEQTPNFQPIKDSGDEGGQFLFILK